MSGKGPKKNWGTAGWGLFCGQKKKEEGLGPLKQKVKAQWEGEKRSLGGEEGNIVWVNHGRIRTLNNLDK